MLRRIPSHIFWPGMVVSILGLSFTANAILVYVATNDGGAQIIDDYYDKAVAWDDQVELLRASEAKGWSIVEMVSEPTEGDQRVITFRVNDREQNPVQGLAAKVTVKSPIKIKDVTTRELVENTKGVYSAVVPMPRIGLYDIEFTVGTGEPMYLHRKRIEVLR